MRFVTNIGKMICKNVVSVYNVAQQNAAGNTESRALRQRFSDKTGCARKKKRGRCEKVEKNPEKPKNFS